MLICTIQELGIACCRIGGVCTNPSRVFKSAAFHEAQAACRGKVTREGDVYGN